MSSTQPHLTAQTDDFPAASHFHNLSPRCCIIITASVVRNTVNIGLLCQTITLGEIICVAVSDKSLLPGKVSGAQELSGICSLRNT